ncbi:N-acetyl-D-Glu racemase DgcA [Kordiimonas sp. SCSIO 12610]|uniref:N-acetyl-D-Glu racemase DgcA n=1 Tax=Kordiimonas sp. SCSIO 12610 TaxID=2829597 RepID=UPI00210D0184|nr:N-acetyl-D-Glu racemase DgcA [Kordiimonas sp. SCSIO 12610]UTW54770.1 hypothetical protein KFF44_13295 [Kordiimonas sp. SCSIO 12610]
MNTKRTLTITEDTWRLKKPFIIARGSRTETKTITVHISENSHTGRGEAVASPRYGESNASIIDEIENLRSDIENGISIENLQTILPAGSARNAIDNALWDLSAKLSNTTVGIASGLGSPNGIKTVQTISILSPDEVFKEARSLAGFPVLKLKLDNSLVSERVQAARSGAPNSKIIIDANESWTPDSLNKNLSMLADMKISMLEQPLPANKDETLINLNAPIPIFADESCHVTADLVNLRDKYQGINIKLDKTGGLSEAIKLYKAAKDMDFEVMVGCMLGTSLGMAPALFIAQHAAYVDVDAPALLAEDRDHHLTIHNGDVSDLNPSLWGA